MDPSSRLPASPARRGLIAVLALAAALAACGGAATRAPATPATPAAVASPTPAAPTPTATPSPTPSASPVAFRSTAYGYATSYPGGWLVDQAKQAWDGEARIDSNGPYVDSMILPGSILFFVYGAPTDLDLAAYADRVQAQVADWHACPAVPGTGPGSEPASYLATDLALDGTPGRLHRMICLGSFVQKLMVVRDGKGIVLNMLAPPGSQAEAVQLFRDLVAGITWPA